MPPPSKVMLIRHGEKPPADDGPPFGVDEAGNEDKHSLIVDGWVRSGALVSYFRASHDSIARPDVIFAARSDTGGPHGKRPAETVLALAATMGVAPNTNYAVGEEGNLALDVLGRNGCVLIAWEHHAIGDIVRHLGNVDFDEDWPNRFDLVWVLDWNGNSYDFKATSQRLLAGDG